MKLLKMSNFTFSHNVFYAIFILKSFNSNISFVVCSFFEFGTISKWCIGEWDRSKNVKKGNCILLTLYHTVATFEAPEEKGEKTLKHIAGKGEKYILILICICSSNIGRWPSIQNNNSLSTK